MCGSGVWYGSKKSWGFYSKHTVRHGSVPPGDGQLRESQCLFSGSAADSAELSPRGLSLRSIRRQWSGGIATIKRDDYSSGTRFQCLSRVAAVLCLSGHRPEVLRLGEVCRLSPFSVGCKNDFPKSEKMTLLQGKKCYM